MIIPQASVSHRREEEGRPERSPSLPSPVDGARICSVSNNAYIDNAMMPCLKIILTLKFIYMSTHL